jgi:hypothetical protein
MAREAGRRCGFGRVAFLGGTSVAVHAAQTAVDGLLEGVTIDRDVFAFGVREATARNMTGEAFFPSVRYRDGDQQSSRQHQHFRESTNVDTKSATRRTVGGDRWW